jgi:catechol 2,3-dioxygenase-like lactoylglutathione lyase family enzyme
MDCLMDHIVLNVEDDERMMDFYSRILSFEPERFSQYRAGKVPFPSVRLNLNTIIDLFPKKLWRKDAKPGDGHQNLNHFCIALGRDAWDDLLKRLEAQSIPVEEGPVQRWGAHGIGTSVYFRDPENNLIEARYYENLEV